MMKKKKDDKIIIGGRDVKGWNILKLLEWAQELYETYQKEKRERYFMKMLSDEMHTMMRLAQEKLEEANASLWLEAYELEKTKEDAEIPIDEQIRKNKYLEYSNWLKMKSIRQQTAKKAEALKNEWSRETEMAMQKEKTNRKRKFLSTEQEENRKVDELLATQKEEMVFVTNTINDFKVAAQKRADYRYSKNERLNRISHRTELCRVEETWNQLFHNLTKTHEKTLETARLFFRETTESDIKLIGALNKEINSLENKILDSRAKMNSLLEENKMMMKPLSELQKVCRLLDIQMGNYEKDLRGVKVTINMLKTAERALMSSRTELSKEVRRLKVILKNKEEMEKFLEKMCKRNPLEEQNVFSDLLRIFASYEENAKELREAVEKASKERGVEVENWGPLVWGLERAGLEAGRAVGSLAKDLAGACKARDDLIEFVQAKLGPLLRPRKHCSFAKFGNKYTSYSKRPAGLVSRNLFHPNQLKSIKQ